VTALQYQNSLSGAGQILCYLSFCYYGKFFTQCSFFRRNEVFAADIVCDFYGQKFGPHDKNTFIIIVVYVP